MKYAAIGQVCATTCVREDGKRSPEFPGGAGLYALSGLLLSDPQSFLIAGVGRDFDRFFGPWFDRNEASRKGLKMRTDYCNRNEILLSEEGKSTETSVYGEVFKGINYWESEIYARDLRPYLNGLRGIWTTGTWEDVYAQEMAAMKKEFGFRILWDCIRADEVSAEKEAVLRAVGTADLWSLGREEAFALFGISDDAAAVREVRDLGKPCLYIAGNDGVYYVTNEQTEFAPAVRAAAEPENRIGCGECMSAAALYAFCEGLNGRQICAWASIAGGFHTANAGPVDGITPEKRAEAFALLREICE